MVLTTCLFLFLLRYTDSQLVALNFLPQFITLFDSDRNALADKFYDDQVSSGMSSGEKWSNVLQSVHSISVNNRAPRKPEQKEPVAPWDAYLQKSRNLAKITHLPARMSRTHIGAGDIKTFWSTLPATKHPDLETQKDKWIIDCHTLPGLPDISGQNPHGVDGLIISMHGEFIETDAANLSTRTLRSFSRTLIIGPGTNPGGIRVISDMMAYRAHNTIPQVTVQQPVAAPDEELVKQELIRRLSEHTFMTPQSAEVCLKETAWDPDAAFAYFNLHKVFTSQFT